MLRLLKKNITILILLLSAVPLFFIGISDVQSWGDDYAQYLKEGLNISEGKPYHQSNYIYNDLNTEYAPASYPPGFPMIIAPVMHFTGISIRPILYLISFLVATLLFLHFYFFKKYFHPLISVCLAVISVYCPAIIDLKGYVLSDIPLLFFTSLYFVVRQSAAISNNKLIILVISAVMAVLTRTQGFVILLAEGFLLILFTIGQIKKGGFKFSPIFSSPSFKIIVGFFLLYLFVTSIVFPAPMSHMSFYSKFLIPNTDDIFNLFKSNFVYLIELLTNIFKFEAKPYFGAGMISAINYIVFLLAILGIFKTKHESERLHVIFFVLMCLLIVMLPVYQGLRYILPLVPLYILFAARSAQLIFTKLSSRIKSTVAIIFTVVYLFMGTENFSRTPYQANWSPYTAEDISAFSYIKENIHDTSIIIFTKPRALTLYTNKRTMNLAWQVSPEKNTQRFDSMGIKYILFRKELDEQFITNYLKDCACKVDSQKIGKLYTLYIRR